VLGFSDGAGCCDAYDIALLYTFEERVLQAADSPGKLTK
jgi:hypothetical protein